MTWAQYEQMAKRFDELWDEADEILKKFNPCNIKNGSCFRGFLCCHECEFLSRTRGCREKSLACKLWLCPAAREAYPECAALLDQLEEVARSVPFLPLGDNAIKEDITSFYEIVD